MTGAAPAFAAGLSVSAWCLFQGRRAEAMSVAILTGGAMLT
ncbi:hypothetical protein C8N32_11316 [Rhodovulum imhoffii]|uniref:Uncharacterized protein n=1 Tax=Rhodovulum imhoffii TaxID=365340 RepID=A0A2T5BQF9_9RHOB|nr:hypothetical protein [Rhodovulum imhoffii]PTN01408.1 hypothetical protein C8N32_11316 [Rhodovulum imhoffii]